jgi:feruloyl-CoA synthase
MELKEMDGRQVTPFDALTGHFSNSSRLMPAMQATGPDTIAKFLFTSGSTKLPKAVINTQRMWCANQQQMAQSMPVISARTAGAG